MPRTAPTIALLLSLLAGPLRAAPPGVAEIAHGPPSSNRSPYEVNVALDLGISFGALLATGLPRVFLDENAGPHCGLACDRGDVNALDRTVIGYHDETLGLVSDIGVAVGMALPFALHAIDVGVSDPSDGWAGYGTDVVVLVETLALTLSLNNLLNFTYRRPRPYVYDPAVSDAKRLEGESALSFPSGHTSSAFAMATAYSRLFMKRHPDSPLVVPVWLFTYSLASATAILRPLSGDHYWTDVIAGAGIGIGVGLLVPWLHERDDEAEPSDETSAVRWDVRPVALPGGGFGAVLSFR